MTSACEEKTLREKDKYWKKDTSGNFGPPQEIGDNACPNECSGNGACRNGTCICNNDFITADCSLKKGRLLSLYFYGEDFKKLRGKGYLQKRSSRGAL